MECVGIVILPRPLKLLWQVHSKPVYFDSAAEQLTAEDSQMEVDPRMHQSISRCKKGLILQSCFGALWSVIATHLSW